MPIRNMGTLLENIVVVEALRACAQANLAAPIDFLNSFAMPPLAGWYVHKTDYGFSAAHMNALQAGQQPAAQESYQGMLWSCLQQPPMQPGTQGPNGALLCSMLAHYLRRPIRLWLNDIPNGHYGNALPGLAAINKIVQQVLALALAPNGPIVVCGESWPDSLIKPPKTNLADTLAAWMGPTQARIGYLDPMRYRIKNGGPGETDSMSHQHWLRLLATGSACTVISIHFTGHNHWSTLRPEIQSMHNDGIATGYPHTLVVRHSYYHVVCNFKTPEGPEAAHLLAFTLQELVQSAWRSWFQTIGRAADALEVVVL